MEKAILTCLVSVLWRKVSFLLYTLWLNQEILTFPKRCKWLLWKPALFTRRFWSKESVFIVRFSPKSRTSDLKACRSLVTSLSSKGHSSWWLYDVFSETKVKRGCDRFVEDCLVRNFEEYASQKKISKYPKEEKEI